MRRDEWMAINSEMENKTAKIYQEVEEQKAGQQGQGPYPTEEVLSEPKQEPKMPDGDFTDEESVAEREWFERHIG